MGEEGESTISGVTGEQVNLNIRCSNGQKFSVRSSLQLSVAEFKRVLARSSDVPAEQQRLIYKGRILKDDQSLGSYGLQADHTIHMIRGSAPPGPNPLSDAHKVGNSDTTLPVAQDVGSGEGGGVGGVGLGASLFPGLGVNLPGGGGVSDLFGAGLPDFDQVEQQVTMNPNMTRAFMDWSTIQNLMSNPEWMRSVIMNNPQMRQIIEQNPELGHVLNDPGILRQTLEAARNPELMREMMRNADRAMSNIESSPEGFNMLRRMYENVQEPFMNATTNGGGTGNDLGFNPFAALLGNLGGVNQSREGSNITSTTGSETGSRAAAPNSNPLPNPWNSSGGATRSNGARSNSTGNARTPGIVGSGGLGLPEMEGIFGTLDSSALNLFMENPAVTQIQGLNPQFRSMLDSNPQLREMIQNPDILRQLSSPETMQQMYALQKQLSQLNRQQQTPEGAQTGGTTGTQNNAGLGLPFGIFGGLGAGGLAVPTTPGVPPEELYAIQLSQLREMGFIDTEENIRALRATFGNVQGAVERLLGNHGQ